MKIWLFRVIALSIPLLFFVLLEFGLRFFGYGQVYPLFIENPLDQQYLLPRPDIVKRYFPNQSDVPSVSIEANFFRKQKPTNGLRFFVQGGSTAAGFPYGLSASVAGMLDQRLKQTFPNHYVEVINTALAAVNSYTVLDMVDEIIEQQPDAVLIYMGHNEYLGILGVGSNYTAANSNASTLMFLKLKELRAFQLLQSIYQQFATDSNKVEQSRTFMAKVAKHKNIPFDSDLYRAGLAQFENNLSIILKKYQAAKVPVYISTVTSNLSAQKPFSSAPVSAEIKQVLDALGSQFSQGTTNNQQLLVIEQKLKASTNAAEHFELGKLFYAIDNMSKAKHHFTLAKDYDLLRFRAPQAFNQIVVRLAAKYDAVRVNSLQRFEQRSRGEIVGSNLMLEHLHPNVEGYFLLSDEFYQAFKQHQQMAVWHDIPIKMAWKQRPLLPAEEYLGFAKILQLKSDYPFVDEKIPLKLPFPNGWEQKLGSDLFNKKMNWLEMTQASLKNYQRDKNSIQVLKSQLLIADAIPNDINENLKAAKLLSKISDPRAVTYYQRAIWAGDSSEKTAKNLQNIKLD